MIRGQISYTISGSDPTQPLVPPLSTTAARYSSDRALHSLPSELEIINPCRAAKKGAQSTQMLGNKLVGTNLLPRLNFVWAESTEVWVRSICAASEVL